MNERINDYCFQVSWMSTFEIPFSCPQKIIKCLKKNYGRQYIMEVFQCIHCFCSANTNPTQPNYQKTATEKDVQYSREHIFRWCIWNFRIIFNWRNYFILKIIKHLVSITIIKIESFIWCIQFNVDLELVIRILLISFHFPHC